MNKIVALIIPMLIALTASAQFEVGHRQITFQDPARSNRDIQTEIYYPATTAGDNVAVASGQFPIVVFGHGFVMAWSAYDNIWNSLVPLGYIVAMPRTEGSISPDHEEFGKDLAFLVNKLKTEGSSASSPFYQKISSTAAIMGHSMGGGSSFLACENNSLPNAMVTFAAANTNPSSIDAAANISIPSLVISGADDCVAPPGDHQLPMYNALATTCKVYISIKDGGHCNFANYNFNCTIGEETCSPGGVPLSRENQQATTMNFVIPYLDYFLKNNIPSWYHFVDSLGTSTRITWQKSCNIDPYWVTDDAGSAGITLLNRPSGEIPCVVSTIGLINARISLLDVSGRLLGFRQFDEIQAGQAISVAESLNCSGFFLVKIDAENIRPVVLKAWIP